jgi:hypothetical protein
LFVDAHLHVGLHGISSSNLITYLDRNKMDQCWLLTWEEKSPRHPWYLPLTIESVFQAYQKYPSRVVPMYAPDPSGDSWESSMEFWFRLGIRGIGELKVTSSWYDKHITDLLDVAVKLRLPLIFHMEASCSAYWPLTSSAAERMACRLLNKTRSLSMGQRSLEYVTENSQLARSILDPRYRSFPGYLPEFSGLEQRLKEYPQVTFVGHGPLFWKGISSDMGTEIYPKKPIQRGGILPRLLTKYQNLYADISGMSGFNALSRDRKFSQQLLTEFSSKILFGTDNASLGLESLLKRMALSYTDIRKICGENALRIMEGAGI